MTDRERRTTPPSFDRMTIPGEVREVRRDISRINAELAAARVERSSLHDAFVRIGLDVQAMEKRISAIDIQIASLVLMSPSIDKLGMHLESLRESVDGLQKWRTGMVYGGLAVVGICSAISTVAAVLVQLVTK